MMAVQVKNSTFQMNHFEEVKFMFSTLHIVD